MEVKFICKNKASWRYPTKAEFKEALSHLDVTILFNELFLNMEPVPYFVVFFNKKDDDYFEWCQTNERVIHSRLWTYTAYKIEPF